MFRDPECAGGGIRAGGWVRAEQLAHEGEEVLDVGVGWTCMWAGPLSAAAVASPNNPKFRTTAVLGRPIWSHDLPIL